MLISVIISGFFGLSSESRAGSFGNVALINIDGPIMSHSSSGGIFGSEGFSSSFVVETLRNIANDDSIIAVVLSIDSPGGGAVASQEIVQALKDLDKPKISIIRSLGASGAYWVASATDKIYSNPLSIVGSIGVTSSYLEFSGLLERYNITYERIVSGDHKDLGSPFRSLTDQEREMLLNQINIVHDFFVSDVAANRNMDKESLEMLATGQIFIGSEALNNGLIDEIGTIDDVKNYLEETMNTTVTFKQIQRRRSFFDIMSLIGNDFAFNFGKGFASWMTQERQEEILSLR